jgi:hypothetical protein
LKAAIEKIKEIRILFNSLIPHPSELVKKQNQSLEGRSMMDIDLVESKIVPDRLQFNRSREERQKIEPEDDFWVENYQQNENPDMRIEDSLFLGGKK